MSHDCVPSFLAVPYNHFMLLAPPKTIQIISAPATGKSRSTPLACNVIMSVWLLITVAFRDAGHDPLLYLNLRKNHHTSTKDKTDFSKDQSPSRTFRCNGCCEISFRTVQSKLKLNDRPNILLFILLWNVIIVTSKVKQIRHFPAIEKKKKKKIKWNAKLYPVKWNLMKCKLMTAFNKWWIRLTVFFHYTANSPNH